MYEVGNSRINEMLPDVLDKCPDLIVRVGTIQLHTVIRTLLMDRDEPGCLAEDKETWRITDEELSIIWKIAEDHGCDFSSGSWV